VFAVTYVRIKICTTFCTLTFKNQFISVTYRMLFDDVHISALSKQHIDYKFLVQVH